MKNADLWRFLPYFSDGRHDLRRAALHMEHLHETRRQRCSPRGEGQQAQARGALSDLILGCAQFSIEIGKNTTRMMIFK